MLAGFSSTGPLVVRMLAPISSAMMYASVVLPNPGGPESSTWSSVSWRRCAAVMNTRRLSLILSCPMKSSSLRGRSAFSMSSSECRECGERFSGCSGLFMRIAEDNGAGRGSYRKDTVSGRQVRLALEKICAGKAGGGDSAQSPGGSNAFGVAAARNALAAAGNALAQGRSFRARLMCKNLALYLRIAYIAGKDRQATGSSLQKNRFQAFYTSYVRSC